MEVTREQRLIYSGKVCPYCGKQSQLVDSQVVYGKPFGKLYLCTPCDAYVGVHKGTDKAKGRLANRALRYWKKEAHKYFDVIWQQDIMSRRSAYKWLSSQLNIPAKYTHIGMFSIKTCQSVVNLSKNVLNGHGFRV